MYNSVYPLLESPFNLLPFTLRLQILLISFLASTHFSSIDFSSIKSESDHFLDFSRSLAKSWPNLFAYPKGDVLLVAATILRLKTMRFNTSTRSPRKVQLNSKLRSEVFGVNDRHILLNIMTIRSTGDLNDDGRVDLAATDNDAGEVAREKVIPDKKKEKRSTKTKCVTLFRCSTLTYYIDIFRPLSLRALKAIINHATNMEYEYQRNQLLGTGTSSASGSSRLAPVPSNPTVPVVTAAKQKATSGTKKDPKAKTKTKVTSSAQQKENSARVDVDAQMEWD